MPRNHGLTAIPATRTTFHSKLRTILRLLTFLAIVLRASLAQERSSSHYEDDQNYLVKWNDAYGRPTGPSIFVKGVDNERNERDTSTGGGPKETTTFEGSKERRYSRWWKDKEEERREDDVNKDILTGLRVNTVKRTIGKEYLKSRGGELVEEIKEDEESEEEKGREKERENSGNNEESSRSKEERNSNNFMTKPGTPRNRRSETEVRGGRRSSWILHGASIKRSNREEDDAAAAVRGNLDRKGEMSFSMASELDDDLRGEKDEEKEATKRRKRKRRRRERKRRRRGTNSSVTLDEWEASNRSVLEKREVRPEVVKATKKEAVKMGRVMENEEEKRKFVTTGRTTISSRIEWPIKKETREEQKGRKNGNRVQSYEGNFGKSEELTKGSNVNRSRQDVVDNVSNDRTLSYLSQRVGKSTGREESDVFLNGGRLAENSRISRRYRDNSEFGVKTIGFRSSKKTVKEEKNRVTTREGRNFLRDKRKGEERGLGEDADLKSEKGNVLVTGGVLKEFSSESVEPTADFPPGSIKYKKGKRRQEDGNWIGENEVAVTNGNDAFSAFSAFSSSTLVKNMKREKDEKEEKSRDEDQKRATILSTTPIYIAQVRKEEIEAESPAKSSRRMTTETEGGGGGGGGGKEAVSVSVRNISGNTVVSWNSTYPNHDTFDSSWVYSSTGWSIVESNDRGTVESSRKDSERNTGDRMEHRSESTGFFETFLSRFPIANASIVMSETEHPRDVGERGKVQRYGDEGELEKTRRNKLEGVTFEMREEEEEEEEEEEGTTTETISLEYFPRSTSLTNSEITATERATVEENARKAEDREVSDYEKEINDTASEPPVSTYKFELLEGVTECDSTRTSTSNDNIREKTKGKDGNGNGNADVAAKVKQLKEEDNRGEDSPLNRTILLKSKRSKSIGLTRSDGGSGSGTSSDSDGKARVSEKSVRKEETKTYENVDPISKSRGKFRTSWLRGESTETTTTMTSTRTTDVSTVVSSVGRSSSPVSSSGPSDRSISVTSVEIEGITTSPLLLDVSSAFPTGTDWANRIVATSIAGNVRATSDVTEGSRISWEEQAAIGNVSSSRQSIGSAHNASITNQWPVKHSAVVEGDLVLGGLMMVHEREDTITCGPVMPQGGVQALEAMLYTLDTLNQREIVPGVKIGAHILDDCDKDTYGLEMAVDFIKGSISNIDGAEYHCNKTTVRKVISGVVGAASSVTSIQVANLLRLFRIPQVSFFSTSPELSNKQRFEYFTRTIPSDHYQVKAMVDIVLKMGWSYVSIIYEESNYGIKAFEELEELLTKNDICIAVKEKLVKDSGVAEETAYDNIVLKLLTKPRAKGCIIFGSDQEVAGVMRAVRRCNATGAFSWIGSDGWSARGLVSNGNEAEVEGTLSVQPQANPVRGFEEYFLNLTVENNRRNPWFVEFWEDHFQCRYPNSSWTPYNKKYTKICSTKERLTKENTVFEDQLQFVSDAVMAFAYAFRDMHRDLCGGKAGLCDAMKPTKGTELLRYLRKVNFEGLSGDKFRFDKNGDGPARYNIIHFKQTEPGVYKWIRVGKYLEGVLHLNMSMVQFKLGHNQTPESVCSLPCEVGQAKKYVEGESCCWHCFNCSQYQIRHPDDETQCENCRQGTVPDETHSTCREIPEEFLRLESGWAIGAMSFSSIGILVTLFVCGVFLKHNDTPVVRASGRELSYVLLTGILLCYLVTFALVLRPTDLVCSIQRFGAGFCFTVVYAALLTKTNRISRIFNAGKHSAKRPSFISPRSQLIICSGLVGVQILINGVWIVIDPAKAMHHYPTKEDNLLVCNSYIDASYMIAFAYPIMLIVVCTVYAVLTRKIPEAFNESKYIGFTMYTTCVIWLAFVPLYFGTGNHVALRITSMSVTISLSASVTIACLFTPKLYIILIRPERNVRQNIMPPRPYNTTKSSAVTGTNASSMMAPVTLTAVTCDQNKAVKKHIITTIDCSTQSEYYELEVKELKNGRPPPSFVTRATQTQSNNNEKEPNDGVHHVDKETKDNARQTNNTKIGNGPVNQNDVAL